MSEPEELTDSEEEVAEEPRLIPKTREEMIDFLVRRAYPLKKKRDGKGGTWRSFYAYGRELFLQSLRSQPQRVIEALHDSALREQERRRIEARENKKRGL